MSESLTAQQRIRLYADLRGSMTFRGETLRGIADLLDRAEAFKRDGEAAYEKAFHLYRRSSFLNLAAFVWLLGGAAFWLTAGVSP